jgi:TRAP transporter TAXI family solute receptor
MRPMLAGLALAACLTTGAMAETIGIGTTQVGATSQIASAIAKVVSEKGGIQMRTQPMAGAAQYIPIVNAGQLEFGIANIVETAYAVRGKVILEGRPNPELRMVARLFPFVAGLVVAKDGPVKTMADFKGQPVPAGFSGNPLGQVIMEGYLATAGLSLGDTKQVLVPSFPRMFDSFKQKSTVTSIAAVGSGILKDFDVSLGGIRYVSFDDTPKSRAALQKFLPQAYFTEVKPMPGETGIEVPTRLIAYDYVLFAGAKVSDDVVAKVVAAMHANPADLKATGPLWKEFEPARMSVDVGIPYHPGAIKYYTDKGQWPAK